MNTIDELSNPWAAARQEFACGHDKAHPVRFVKANGAVCVRIQCPRCGAALGEKPKTQYHVDRLPEWNEALRQTWEAQINRRGAELRDAQSAAWAQEREHERAEWQAAYRCYLQSEHWRRLKQFVLDRDRARCQNCGRVVTRNIFPMPDRAEVHHLSYDGFRRLGKSFAFECVTLCHNCHREYHGTEHGDDEPT